LFSFLIPTIRLACKFCKDTLSVHNSGFPEERMLYTNFSKNSGAEICEVFTFPFECQACKGEPIFYLVRREGLKFTITGRSHFPKVAMLKSLPEEEVSYFRGAIIGHATGQILAALFLLRVFIEQYMRRVTKTTGKITGDELADKYASLLPSDFPQRFDSL